MFKVFNGTILIFFIFAISAFAANDDYCAEARKSPLRIGDVINKIYWSDADSGRVNGVCFRLANVDAPETGYVGGRGGAECEHERKIGFVAKSKTISMTKTGDIRVLDTYGFDHYNRQILSLEVKGQEWAATGLSAGIYKSWEFRNGKALEPKPDFCQP